MLPIQIVSHSADCLVIKQRCGLGKTLLAVSWNLVLFPVLIFYIVSLVLIIFSGPFQSFFHFSLRFLWLVWETVFLAIFVGHTISFLFLFPLQTIWTFDRNVQYFNALHYSVIGWQRLVRKNYRTQTLQLYYGEIDYYHTGRYSSYLESQAWAFVRWESPSTGIGWAKKVDEANIKELRLSLDRGAIYRNLGEIEGRGLIAPPEAIELFNQLGEFFKRNDNSQLICPDILLYEGGFSRLQFDNPEEQLSMFKREFLGFRSSLYKKVSLSRSRIINANLESTWRGDNLILNHREGDIKTIALPYREGFINYRILSWFNTKNC